MSDDINLNNRVNQVTGSIDWLTFAEAGLPVQPELYQIINLDGNRATDGGHVRNLFGIRLGKVPDPDTLEIYEYIPDSDSDDFDSDTETGAQYTKMPQGEWPPNTGEFATIGNGDIVYFHPSRVGEFVAVLPTYTFKSTPLTFGRIAKSVQAAISGEVETIVDEAVAAATPGIISDALAAISVTDTNSLDLSYNTGTGNLTGESIGIKNQGSEAGTLKKKTIAIGSWNMNSTASVDIAHGLTAANIRSITGQIRNDSNNTYYPITPGDGGGTSQRAYIEYHDGTNVRIGRNGTALFGTNAEFDGTGFSRGFLTVEYIV